MTVELDPRWEWVDVSTRADRPMDVKGACRHTEVVPVESVEGEAVAQLCVTCDAQFPPSTEPG